MCLRVNIIGATRGVGIEYLDTPPEGVIPLSRA